MLMSKRLMPEYPATLNKITGRIKVSISLINLLAGLLFILLSSSSIRAEQTVRVGIYRNSPKVAVSESGQPEGIFVDIIEAIAREEGWSLKYVQGTWTEGLDPESQNEILK